MWRTDDPERDYARYEAEQNKQLEKLPRCSECDEPIQEEYCFEINGEYICENCMNENHRKCVDDILYDMYGDYEE